MILWQITSYIFNKYSLEVVSAFNGNPFRRYRRVHLVIRPFSRQSFVFTDFSSTNQLSLLFTPLLIHSVQLTLGSTHIVGRRPLLFVRKAFSPRFLLFPFGFSPVSRLSILCIEDSPEHAADSPDRTFLKRAREARDSVITGVAAVVFCRRTRGRRLYCNQFQRKSHPQR